MGKVVDYLTKDGETTENLEEAEFIVETNVRELGKRNIDPNVGGGVDRDELESSDFVFPDTKTFPVAKPSDVSDAVSSWGRYKGPKSFEDFQKQLTALCRRKGELFVAALPKAWEVEKGLVELVKYDEFQGLLYGVVLKPEIADAQKDIMSAIEIEKTAHGWMAKSRMYDYQHAAVLEGGEAVVVESYIAPCDLSYEEGGKVVVKGSWVVVTKLLDEGVKDKFRVGRIGAYSIRGFGKRRPVKKSVEDILVDFVTGGKHG